MISPSHLIVSVAADVLVAPSPTYKPSIEAVVALNDVPSNVPVGPVGPVGPGGPADPPGPAVSYTHLTLPTKRIV